MIRTTLFRAAFLATAFSLSSSAYANAAELFVGSGDGVFGEPTTIFPAIFTGVGTDTFTNGFPSTSPEPDSVSFTGSAFEVMTGTPFTIGTLSYTNNVTVVGTTVDSVPLLANLNLSAPSAFNQPLEFDLAFNETVNDGASPDEDADSLFATTSASDFSFESNGSQFIFEVLGFSQDGGATINNEFVALEEATVTGLLRGRITEVDDAEDIPEPAAILGLGAFVVLATTTTRRKMFSGAKAA